MVLNFTTIKRDSMTVISIINLPSEIIELNFYSSKLHLFWNEGICLGMPQIVRNKCLSKMSLPFLSTHVSHIFVYSFVFPSRPEEKDQKCDLNSNNKVLFLHFFFLIYFFILIFFSYKKKSHMFESCNIIRILNGALVSLGKFVEILNN